MVKGWWDGGEGTRVRQKKVGKGLSGRALAEGVMGKAAEQHQMDMQYGSNRLRNERKWVRIVLRSHVS